MTIEGSKGEKVLRHRTGSRSRYVAPPGMEVESEPNLATIGRYEILETLGKGAMGIVYKARDPLLDRIVAVKTIVSPKHSGKRHRRAYLERFEREAKAAAKMQHPSIVTIFDVGNEEGQPFMVLEYLPGDSLSDRLDRVRMPLGKAVQTAIDLAGALGFAHGERIVHRDVKPANVLDAGGDRWKLADFGIARIPDSELTQVGIFMGTPGYAPPEAISQGTYTPQADVFAWGAVFYELLSGRVPYEGPDTTTTNGYVLDGGAPSPRRYDPSIPEVLANVCMTALHPSTEVRYAGGLAVQVALEDAWERCISENLVTAKAFSAREFPHDEVPEDMHAASRSDPIMAALTLVSAKPIAVRDQAGADESVPTTAAPSAPQSLSAAAHEEAKSPARQLEDEDSATRQSPDTLKADTLRAGLLGAAIFATILAAALAGYFLLLAR